jgi:hypothetical protein
MIEPIPAHVVLNLPARDHFGQPKKDSFRMWSNNAIGLLAANGFATLH